MHGNTQLDSGTGATVTLPIRAAARCHVCGANSDEAPIVIEPCNGGLALCVACCRDAERESGP